MLEKFREQENIIMLFFIITIILVGIYGLMFVNVIDLLYLIIIIYYFSCFLKIRNCGK